MSLITFTSDFGISDHYVAAVKARIFNINPQIKVVDITHNVEHFNIAHGAYVLNAVFRDFPEGTVHLVAVNSHGNKEDHYIAAKIENHYFVGCNNGLFSLLSNDDAFIVTLDQFEESFPEKSIFADASAQLANGTSIENIGKEYNQGLKRLVNPEPKLTKEQITGNIIYTDNYGNLISNIPKYAFEQIVGNKNFEIYFGRNRINNLDATYNKQDEGDVVILFNSHNLLEIAINKGNAAQLLGMGYNSPVTIRVGHEK